MSRPNAKWAMIGVALCFLSAIAGMVGEPAASAGLQAELLANTQTPTRTRTSTRTRTPTRTPTVTVTPTEEPTVFETVPPPTDTPSSTPTLTATPTPTDTPTPTATCTPTPRPAYLPVLLKQRRLLQNGDFESGAFAPGWRDSGVLSRAIVSGTQQFSGKYGALLGNPAYQNRSCPVGEAVISQIIDIPPYGHPSLSFWYKMLSYDTKDFDYFVVTITEWPSGPTYELMRTGRTDWDDTLWDSGWKSKSLSLDDYRGKSVTLAFRNVMTNADGWYNTWTYMDEVRYEIIIQR